MNNLLSKCGLVDAEIRASDKDLPVLENYFSYRNNRVFFAQGIIVLANQNNYFVKIITFPKNLLCNFWKKLS